MNEERTSQHPQANGAPKAPQTIEEVVQRHLQDENHVITDEELRNVQIGHSSEPPQTGAEAQARFDAENKTQQEEDDSTKPDADNQPLTPWDVTT